MVTIGAMKLQSTQRGTKPLPHGTFTTVPSPRPLPESGIYLLAAEFVTCYRRRGLLLGIRQVLMHICLLGGEQPVVPALAPLVLCQHLHLGACGRLTGTGSSRGVRDAAGTHVSMDCERSHTPRAEIAQLMAWLWQPAAREDALPEGAGPGEHWP